MMHNSFQFQSSLAITLRNLRHAVKHCHIFVAQHKVKDVQVGLQVVSTCAPDDERGSLLDGPPEQDMHDGPAMALCYCRNFGLSARHFEWTGQ